MPGKAPGRIYPNLEGIANPKSSFEVQTSQFMKQAFDYIYQNADDVAGLKKSASGSSPGSGAPSTSSGNWWNTAYGVDTFAVTDGGTSLTVTWTGLRIAPTSFVNRLTSFLNVANGSQANPGLTSGTTYWFYPGYDTRSGNVVFGTDPAFVVAGTAAHTAPSGVALMKVSSGGIVPLSPNGFSVQAGGGNQTGLGGGLLYGVPLSVSQ